MVNLLSSLFLTLIILIVVLLTTFVVTLGFLFVGGVLADWFDLARLEATGIALVVGFMLIFLVVRILEIPGPFIELPDDWEAGKKEPEPPRHRDRRRPRKK